MTLIGAVGCMRLMQMDIREYSKLNISESSRLSTCIRRMDPTFVHMNATEQSFASDNNKLSKIWWWVRIDVKLWHFNVFGWNDTWIPGIKASSWKRLVIKMSTSAARQHHSRRHLLTGSSPHSDIISSTRSTSAIKKRAWKFAALKMHRSEPQIASPFSVCAFRINPKLEWGKCMIISHRPLINYTTFGLYTVTANLNSFFNSS